MLLLWILTLLISSSCQATGPNCLRNNVGVIDVELDFFREVPNNHETSNTTEQITNHLSFMSTRFKRVHMRPFSYGSVKSQLDWISLHANASKENVSFVIYLSDDILNRFDFKLQNSASVYEDVYRTIKEVNLAHERPLIFGVYLSHLTYSRPEIRMLHEEALEKVFKEDNSSELALGRLESNCPNVFSGFYKTPVDFITCLTYYPDSPFTSETPSPEEYADAIIEACDQLRDQAKLIKFNVEVMCKTGYPSKGAYKMEDRETRVLKYKIEGSVKNMARFWCRIVSELASNKSHARIILSPAFDDAIPSPMEEYEATTNYGWWRRTSFYGSGQFIEKVEELPGGTEYGKCAGVCQLCRKPEDCCEGFLCATEFSFPIQTIRDSVKFCKTLEDNCTFSFDPSNKPEKPNVPQSESRNPGWDNIAIAIFTLCGIILFSVVAFFIHSRVALKSVLSRQEINNFFQGSPSFAGEFIAGHMDTHEIVENRPYDDKLEVAKEAFEIQKEGFLGRGEFGVVVKGRLGNDEVAVKTTLPGVDKVFLKALLLELKVLLYLEHHENIVNLRGANTRGLNSGKLYLFLELCPLGNSLDFLRSHRNHFSETEAPNVFCVEGEERRMTTKELLQWSLQVASAMQHLEDKKVIHGDIAARNILVFSLDQVKLTDFGLSRRLYERSIYTKKDKGPLPWRHMSVEALRDFQFSLASDVWAFGTTLWEIFSLGEVPFSGRSYSEEFLQLLIDGLCLPCPRIAHPLVYELMTSCWTTDVQLRPSIKNIHSKLAFALNQLFTQDLYFNPFDLKSNIPEATLPLTDYHNISPANSTSS